MSQSFESLLFEIFTLHFPTLDFSKICLTTTTTTLRVPFRTVPSPSATTLSVSSTHYYPQSAIQDSSLTLCHNSLSSFHSLLPSECHSGQFPHPLPQLSQFLPLTTTLRVPFRTVPSPSATTLSVPSTHYYPQSAIQDSSLTLCHNSLSSSTHYYPQSAIQDNSLTLCHNSLSSFHSLLPSECHSGQFPHPLPQLSQFLPLTTTLRVPFRTVPSPSATTLSVPSTHYYPQSTIQDSSLTLCHNSLNSFHSLLPSECHSGQFPHPLPQLSQFLPLTTTLRVPFRTVPSPSATTLSVPSTHYYPQSAIQDSSLTLCHNSLSSFHSLLPSECHSGQFPHPLPQFSQFLPLTTTLRVPFRTVPSPSATTLSVPSTHYYPQSAIQDSSLTLCHNSLSSFHSLLPSECHSGQFPHPLPQLSQFLPLTTTLRVPFRTVPSPSATTLSVPSTHYYPQSAIQDSSLTLCHNSLSSFHSLLPSECHSGQFPHPLPQLSQFLPLTTTLRVPFRTVPSVAPSAASK